MNESNRCFKVYSSDHKTEKGQGKREGDIERERDNYARREEGGERETLTYRYFQRSSHRQGRL